jgi:pyruvate formate lyase activating enzyme
MRMGLGGLFYSIKKACRSYNMSLRISRRKFIKDAVQKGTAIAVASKAITDFSWAESIPADHSAVDTTSLTEAMFYEKNEGVMIKCLLEPRGCIVNNWERGYCGAKENRDGKYSMVYSRPSAVYVEAIETDHFFHIKPGNQFLGLGTAGCNLGCKFCETWHLSQVRPEETEIQNLTPEDAIRQAQNKNSKIINFTYNDPIICYEYVLETAKLAKKSGFLTLCHTAGYVSEEPLKTLLKYIDAVNIDLKGFTENYYAKYCGVDLETVLKSLKTIKQEKVMLEITNLIVTGNNDNKDEITKMITWIIENLGDDVPLHFSRFYPNYQLTELLATPEETLEMAHDIAKSKGIKYVYIDNVPGHEYESTYCAKCKAKLINRNGTEVTILDIDKDGVCKKCGCKIPGIWS